jgi:ribokinase
VSTIDVAVLGGINTDFLVRAEHFPSAGHSTQGNAFQQGIGGKGANQAIAAARLGMLTAMIGCVGKDERGEALLAELAAEHVDFRFVHQVEDTSTGATLIMIDETGRKLITTAEGANMSLPVSAVMAAKDVIAGARVLLVNLETPLKCVLAAARVARQHGVPVLLDAGPAPKQPLPRELLDGLTLIHANAKEAEALTGVYVVDEGAADAAARGLMGHGVQYVALEVGSSAKLFRSATGRYLFANLPVKRVDPTGAGDAAVAALAVAFAERLSLKEAAEMAVCAAAHATTVLGAAAGLPTRAQIEALRERYSDRLNSATRPYASP